MCSADTSPKHGFLQNTLRFGGCSSSFPLYTKQTWKLNTFNTYPVLVSKIFHANMEISFQKPKKRFHINRCQAVLNTYKQSLSHPVASLFLCNVNKGKKQQQQEKKHSPKWAASEIFKENTGKKYTVVPTYLGSKQSSPPVDAQKCR